MAKDSKVRQENGVVLSFIPTGEYYFNKGINAFHRHDLTGARKYLERAIQLEPYEPMIACQLGLVYMQLEQYQESNDLFNRILEELDPSMTECLYFLANNFAELGLFSEAKNYATSYLDTDPYGEFIEDAEDLLYIVGMEEDGEDDFPIKDELILKQDKARQLLESGNFEKAVEILTNVIEEFPDFWSAYNNLALGYFYLGDMDKAASVLDELLVKNPGNLHGICNLAVFLYHQRRDQELQVLLEGLEKVKPLLIEHKYKLGATFALIGRYKQAYMWLNKLKKYGFEGDSSYYYWLAQSAYYTGHEQTAKNAWKQLLELNPEKEGQEPWNYRNAQGVGFEDDVTSTLKKLRSDYMEERLFGVFILSKSTRKDEMVSHPDFKSLDEFSLTEKVYLANVLDADLKKQFDPNGIISRAHQVADILYEKHHPIDAASSGLFLMWFSVFLEGVKNGQEFTNLRGFAAATEYLWNKLKHEKKSQVEISKTYEISNSTLQKYTKIVLQYCK
ncbi:tetratricopeptide repeat protein [Heyndrickxia sporothermodurans]|uniref:tetratricopeptide repeat protein n=1 Tax=Heyndrickxia sporothermodurans TaxID=46224 RepID=UPI000D364917|nr:tetratricopeptide repeat protein [Heyndrickxia sporothermodurans]MBL5793477.1 tetratricopeptide repeat protein [Heyndrickxia sporothermodurans]MBL5854494.1 tetratricopeptide repeat protein [Heyndrickxia sporothermodurans]PTY75962.1 tetratricopeptide repeat protein [Heyndrickxia sporothermodurans]